MGGPDVALETAGGLDLPDHPIGTDAVLVMAAIERAWSDDGVLALLWNVRDESVAELPCLAVPTDLLRYTIAEGPRTVDDDTLERLTRMRLQLPVL